MLPSKVGSTGSPARSFLVGRNSKSSFATCLSCPDKEEVRYSIYSSVKSVSGSTKTASSKFASAIQKFFQNRKTSAGAMACITRSRPHDECTFSKSGNRTCKVQLSVDHNPEDLKSIYKQVPNMTAKRFLKLENCKSLAHAKRFAFGEAKFLSG